MKFIQVTPELNFLRNISASLPKAMLRAVDDDYGSRPPFLRCPAALASLKPLPGTSSACMLEESDGSLKTLEDYQRLMRRTQVKTPEFNFSPGHVEDGSESATDSDESQPITFWEACQPEPSESQSFSSLIQQLRRGPSNMDMDSSSQFSFEPVSASPLPIDSSNLERHYFTIDQRNKNYHLLKKWTDGGPSPRDRAMTIAATLYNSKVTEQDLLRELTQKEKFAYKKFCLEIEDKLQLMLIKPQKKRDALLERTLRKIWPLYALYTKTLTEDMWGECFMQGEHILINFKPSDSAFLRKNIHNFLILLCIFYRRHYKQSNQSSGSASHCRSRCFDWRKVRIGEKSGENQGPNGDGESCPCRIPGGSHRRLSRCLRQICDNWKGQHVSTIAKNCYFQRNCRRVL